MECRCLMRNMAVQQGPPVEFAVSIRFGEVEQRGSCIDCSGFLRLLSWMLDSAVAVAIASVRCNLACS